VPPLAASPSAPIGVARPLELNGVLTADAAAVGFRIVGERAEHASAVA